MATSQCTPCRLNRENCRGSPPTDPIEISPQFCCSWYFVSFIFFFIFSLPFEAMDSLFGQKECNLEFFTNSITVSNALNANASNTDWRIGFVTKSPVTNCKISLHTMKSRLLLGDEVISEVSLTSDSFGQLVDSDKTDGPGTSVGFENVVTPGVIGGVVWDFRVELVAKVKADSGHGILMVFCGGLPVNFTVDPTRKVVGSLLGNMRRCEYLFGQDN